MAKKQQAVAMLVFLAALVVVAATSAEAQQCNASNLAPCAPAILTGSTPTSSCCSNLRAQRSCFCQYARNPAYASYINSPNARNTLTSCGVAIPTC